MFLLFIFSNMFRVFRQLEDVEMFRILQDPNSSIDPTADNQLAIRKYSEKGMVGIVRLLLQHPNVDPSVMNNEAVRKTNNKEILSMLLHHSLVDPSACDNQALYRARMSGRQDLVNLLLRHPKVLATNVQYSPPFRSVWGEILQEEVDMVKVGKQLRKKFPNDWVEIFKSLDVYDKCSVLGTPEFQLSRFLLLIEPLWMLSRPTKS